MDGGAIAEGAPASLRRIKFSSPRAVYYAQHRLEMPHEGHADAAILAAAGIIGRAVDRIYDPDILVTKIRDIFFLAEKAASGKQGRESGCKIILNGKIGSRDDIFCRAFFFDGKTASHHQSGCLADYLFYEVELYHIYSEREVKVFL